MLVSIIIPTYNRSFFLAEAIQSCLEQTYRPLECIIVDDGSTDDTKKVINEFLKKNSDSFTLKYIYQANAGAQVARNTGTAASAGEFFQYLDSDDLLYPDKLEKQVRFLLAHPECDGVFGDWETGMPDNKRSIKASASGNFLNMFLIERPIAVFAMLMRKALINKIGDWDISLKRNQEIDFHLRGIIAGGNFEYQVLLCGLWRVHNEDRIGNTSKPSYAIDFYRKWENILRKKKLWNNDLSVGIVKNYVWFLGTYRYSETKELHKLLKEMYRLHPEHSIFVNPKFKIARKILGLDKTINLWIKRYKQNLDQANG